MNQLVAENKSLSYDTFNNIYYSMTGNFISPREFKELAPKLEQDLDIVYIGQFPQLSARNVESAYMNGAIFLSNEIADNDIYIKSIIHELAHNVEKILFKDNADNCFKLKLTETKCPSGLSLETVKEIPVQI